LVRRHQALAFRAAYLITGDAADAEDAAQEGFIKAYYHLSRFRPGAPFRPWLLTIVANEARNRRSATARRLDLVARAGAQGGEAEEPSPERSLLAGERRAQLLAALNRLREEERLAVTCRYFLDLSEAEMAATLGCPRGTVKSRLSRALGHLRGVLGSADGISDGRETPDG
jgi:RNA polymerase sigma factor (sigma-70 family)